MRTVATFPADEILPHIGAGRRHIKLAGFSVKTSSARLECFKRNQTCVSCGIVGTMFALQTHVGEPPHLNLYHITESGKRILMTQDHIIPKSRGGGSSQDNLQTMCTVCNHKKGNSMPGDPGPIATKPAQEEQLEEECNFRFVRESYLNFQFTALRPIIFDTDGGERRVLVGSYPFGIATDHIMSKFPWLSELPIGSERIHRVKLTDLNYDPRDRAVVKAAA